MIGHSNINFRFNNKILECNVNDTLSDCICCSQNFRQIHQWMAKSLNEVYEINGKMRKHIQLKQNCFSFPFSTLTYICACNNDTIIWKRQPKCLMSKKKKSISFYHKIGDSLQILKYFNLFLWKSYVTHIEKQNPHFYSQAKDSSFWPVYVVGMLLLSCSSILTMLTFRQMDFDKLKSS